MPRPRKGEKEADFIGRCMASAEARRDKPGQTERLGMCYGLWRQGPVKKQQSHRPLYVNRPLLNGEDVIAWAKGHGFETTLPAEDMHVTVAYSREPVDWTRFAPRTDELRVEASPTRNVAQLGDLGAMVLLFSSESLARRHQAFRAGGASWDHDGYRPHITISYNGPDIDPKDIVPYDGPLIFGPEEFEEITEGWAEGVTEKAMEKRFIGEIAKVDTALGIVFGWGIICNKGGEPYYDSQDDHIPESTMLKAAADFMANSRVGAVMHERSGDNEVVKAGSIVFGYPLTGEIAKALGIQSDQTGLLLAYKPDDEAVLEKFRSGEFTGFSIGGRIVQFEESA